MSKTTVAVSAFAAGGAAAAAALSALPKLLSTGESQESDTSTLLGSAEAGATIHNAAAEGASRLLMLSSHVLPWMFTWGVRGGVLIAGLFAAALLYGLVIGGPNARAAIKTAASNTYFYYATLFYYWLRGGSFADYPYFPESTHARVHLYSLALIMDLWDRPHYRNGSFQHDMLKNLRDVALPGTGVPLSVFARHKLLTYWFLLVAHPLAVLVGAVHLATTSRREQGEEAVDAAKHSLVTRVLRRYAAQLVEPRDWFSLWRLNCRLATRHSSVTGEADYACEDKWTFLTRAEEVGVAVTPFMKVDELVCKHRNEEGGLGYQAFRNAAAGGDWIIQRRLENGPFLASMLPDDAPLSTFRIISASRGGLKSGTDESVVRDDIRALSCVWRAGRSGAATDHSAILFNVDPNTGEIRRGTTNTHWYQRGLQAALATPWSSTHNATDHPDTGRRITGKRVPDMKRIMDFVADAHLRLCPHVPMCGWDVALTRDDGMLLLEGNFSCNFFRGDFDEAWYFEFVADYFRGMEEVEERRRQ